ncbi:MAG: DUF262 domain-containing protein [Clostridium sp.]|nr:DUF262 domain-containing protein [Acetatifactor muris]MCM1527470.1 DUF262 domain-containing protein [Bacteroides sp.]MCM1562084.1 DUF262 domain-containing protein [Clostridium sp.]
MAKPRRQTYTMDMYLHKVSDADIRNDADVQRQFIWSREQIDELVMTVLADDYIPPIVLGEEDSSQLWIVDGGQRTMALAKFRYGNHKIIPGKKNSRISYKKKERDDSGKIVWEDAVCDIRNKTYDKLPEELRKQFNEYQIETVIHEHCDNHRISQLIKRYNNHTAMNTNQKAFTYIDRFARDIREISESGFFVEYSEYSEKEKSKGVVERVIVETVMCTNHLNDWKKQTGAICIYLNRNAAKEEFTELAERIHRLERVITEDIKSIFNSRDSFLFLTLFERFTRSGMEDVLFAQFLREFKNHLRQTRMDGVLFDETGKEKGSKNKAVILAKLDILERMMWDFLRSEEESDKNKMR